mmetsp:Transcript_120115/g.339918  ORF Transcript_120115/g.339918 Transcript_120115/m.339918 type:complete len:225 (-) Transcript_120115:334-1008(-)
MQDTSRAPRGVAVSQREEAGEQQLGDDNSSRFRWMLPARTRDAGAPTSPLATRSSLRSSTTFRKSATATPGRSYLSKKRLCALALASVVLSWIIRLVFDWSSACFRSSSSIATWLERRSAILRSTACDNSPLRALLSPITAAYLFSKVSLFEASSNCFTNDSRKFASSRATVACDSLRAPSSSAARCRSRANCSLVLANTSRCSSRAAWRHTSRTRRRQSQSQA